MDLRLLGYFVAVVDHGSVTEAARSLYVSQPSLSQAIRTLERQLDLELFDRSARRLMLTRQGAAFVPVARQILGDVESARAKVHAVRDRMAGRLDIATLSSLSVDPLATLASRLRRDYPGIILNVVDPSGPAGLVSDLRHGHAELGLATLPLQADTLCNCALGTQEIILVLPPTLAATLPDPVPREAVKHVPLVVETTGAATMTTVLDGALDVTADNIAVECAHPQALWELVKAGAGAAFLPRGLAENELTNVDVRSLAPPIERRIGLVFRPGPLSPAARAFLEVAGITDQEPTRAPS